MQEEFKPKLRRFPKGVSGNPAGRPKKTVGVAALLEASIPAILERVIEAALAGDMSAAAIVLGLPVGKDTR
jgi:hypothetical protein